jgi:hypothetical protein
MTQFFLVANQSLCLLLKLNYLLLLIHEGDVAVALRERMCACVSLTNLARARHNFGEILHLHSLRRCIAVLALEDILSVHREQLLM